MALALFVPVPQIVLQVVERNQEQGTVDPPGFDVLVVMQRQFQLFFLFVVEVPQIQLTDRVLACSCTTEMGTHSENCAENRLDSTVQVAWW